MKRPTRATFNRDEWGVGLREAQAVWDRAYRKSLDLDSRAQFLEESRRPAQGPITRADYLRAIRAPLKPSKAQQAEYESLERRYRDRPREIWTNPPEGNRVVIVDVDAVTDPHYDYVVTVAEIAVDPDTGTATPTGRGVVERISGNRERADQVAQTLLERYFPDV